MKEITIKFKTPSEIQKDSSLLYGELGKHIPVKIYIDNTEIDRLKSFSIKIDESNNMGDISYQVEQYFEYPWDEVEIKNQP